MKQSKDLITLINEQIEWLDENVQSNDILSVGMVLNKLSILSEGFGEMVTDAYSLSNELEDDYKIAFATYIKENTGSVAKLENDAEVACADLKRDWTTVKNNYRKLNTKLDRIDKILESHRQSVSVQVKASLKNMV